MKEITLNELYYNNRLIKLNKPVTFYSDGSYMREHGTRRYGNSNGRYLKMSLYDRKGKEHKVFIHTLMLCIFVSDRPSRHHEVDHIDRDTTNNDVSNLRWVTRKHNCENKKSNVSINEELFIKQFNEADNPFNLTKACVHHRVFYYGWDFKKAMNTPSIGKGEKTENKVAGYEGRKTNLRKWFDSQDSNVKYKTFYARVTRYGWSKEEAIR